MKIRLPRRAKYTLLATPGAEEFDPLDAELDLKKMLREGTRGKHVERFRKSSNIVPLAPDVREAFPTADSVNEALRLVMELSKIPKQTK